MTYARHPTSTIKLPGRRGVRRRVMKMGEDAIESTSAMFSVFDPSFPCSYYSCVGTWQELKGKVALSLDAWTSSNQHAFLAIVAHYITNEGCLGAFVSLCV
jgi:hypothetical protein